MYLDQATVRVAVAKRKIFDFYQKKLSTSSRVFSSDAQLYDIYGWAEKMASFLGPHGELLKSFILFHISDDNLMMSILR